MTDLIAEHRIAHRRLKNARKAEDCSITNAMSGNLVVTFQKVLPYAFDPLHFHQSLRLDAAKVVSPDGTASLMTSFVFTRDKKDACAVLGAVLPRNTWSRRPFPGWRKWYKEFRVYAANAFPASTCRGAPLRELVPPILQTYVDEERQRPLPTHSRGWDGVYHSICRRTGTALPEARGFVDEWLAANPEVLARITETVEKDPYRQYFG